MGDTQTRERALERVGQMLQFEAKNIGILLSC